MHFLSPVTIRWSALPLCSRINNQMPLCIVEFCCFCSKRLKNIHPIFELSSSNEGQFCNSAVNYLVGWHGLLERSSFKQFLYNLTWRPGHSSALRSKLNFLKRENYHWYLPTYYLPTTIQLHFFVITPSSYKAPTLHLF